MTKRNYRKRRDSSDDDEKVGDESISDVIKRAKELQKFRAKPRGIDSSELDKGNVPDVEVPEDEDPFKLKTGGLIDMDHAKKGGVDEMGDKISLGKNFSAETNTFDEDAAMMKYIEVELAKKKGVVSQDDEDSRSGKVLEDSLYELPENLRITSAKKSEEMLSNQMLSGIPEIDLGIDAKLRNIEATENAKLEMLMKRRRKKNEISSMVPINIAVNYVQHTRYVDIDVEEEVISRKTATNDRATTQKRRHNWKNTATDDYHFEKFRKQMRR
ncbi:uncharacterized protein TRIADDRAFT_50676 [Trichoplax adhaerens]|uniref:Hepatocellular carcinoma-associated antigen 59 domain-containing protein n=1 Tax=Trichoplax adhaerens TaxID=10228 RepID=B3S591_TRIAD|nr:hypothetical protein TRIADDRAFT_50676 [Trichoplax adhaerens]EDV22096.1 hypothetical protein TRIADDRAFT_50676 [Trichoplax adhaerens]|eukprot:XP_002115251.1 hypothetical protein TRIADDRAFT_50676 [Trichoplax adhaerens]